MCVLVCACVSADPQILEGALHLLDHLMWVQNSNSGSLEDQQMLSVTETSLQHNPQLLILSSSHINFGEDTNTEALVLAAVMKVVWAG